MNDRDFPFIIKNTELYLDSAATSQALYTVIEDQMDFERSHRSNAHRSGHKFGTWVNNKYFEAKEAISKFLGLDPKGIVFNSGSTQGLNDAVQMIAQEYRRASIYVGRDSHHSLFLPLLALSKSSSFYTLNIVELDGEGRLDLKDLEEKVKNDPNPKIIAATAVSNVLGVINDLDEIKRIAKQYGCSSILDASQIVSKRNVNLSGFDFVAWSWHKVYGPMGLGCLYIDSEWLKCEPIRPGGGSVTTVKDSYAVWQEDAGRFESGTLNLNAISTIPRLISWLTEHMDEIVEHDKMLARIANDNVQLNMFRPICASETGLLSLQPLAGVAEDYGMLLDANDIMVRTGKLCAEPLVAKITDTGLIRISWAIYTSANDLERFYDVLGGVYGKLSRNVR